MQVLEDRLQRALSTRALYGYPGWSELIATRETLQIKIILDAIEAHKQAPKERETHEKRVRYEQQRVVALREKIAVQTGKTPEGQDPQVYTAALRDRLQVLQADLNSACAFAPIKPEGACIEAVSSWAEES